MALCGGWAQQPASVGPFAERALATWLSPGGAAHGYPGRLQRALAVCGEDDNRRAAQLLPDADDDAEFRLCAPEWQAHAFSHSTAGDGSLDAAPRPRSGGGGGGGGGGGDGDDGGGGGAALPLGGIGAPLSGGSGRWGGGAASGGPLCFDGCDLEALARLPWSVKIGRTALGDDGPPDGDEARDLRVATALDLSPAAAFLAARAWAVPEDPDGGGNGGGGGGGGGVSLGRCAAGRDDRLVWVRAVVLDDATGLPKPLPLGHEDDLAAALSVGMDDVASGGALLPPAPTEDIPDFGEDAAYGFGKTRTAAFSFRVARDSGFEACPPRSPRHIIRAGLECVRARVGRL